MRTPQSPETQRMNENQSVPKSTTCRSSLADGMQTLRKLFDRSQSANKKTQHEATRNPAVSLQLQSAITAQPTGSSAISPEQSIGHPMQRELFASTERSDIEYRNRPMIKSDEVESCLPMLTQADKASSGNDNNGGK